MAMLSAMSAGSSEGMLGAHDDERPRDSQTSSGTASRPSSTSKVIKAEGERTVGIIPALAQTVVVKGTNSPQLAQALQATESVWKDVESEYGMLTSTDVARLIGSKESSRSLAANQRAVGKLIGIKRGNRYVYPGFQFDLRSDKVHPAIPGLIAVAAEVGWDEEDLVFWLVSPSGYFRGERPVDHLDDADFTDKVRQAATVEW